MKTNLFKHEAQFSDFKAITLWTDDKDEARAALNQLRADGATFSHIYTDSCLAKYRIIGHFKG